MLDRRARARDRVEARREQHVAEKARAARADVVEAIEHDHVAVPHAELLHRFELARALGLDRASCGATSGRSATSASERARQPLDVVRGIERRPAVSEPRGEALRRLIERDRVLGADLNCAASIVSAHFTASTRCGGGCQPHFAVERCARSAPRTTARVGSKNQVGRCSLLEHLAQRRRLERRRMVIEPPAHLRIGTEPEVDTRVIVGVERARPRTDCRPGGPSRRAGCRRRASIDVAIERREQRRRGRAVEAGVVKEDLEDARQVACRCIPRSGIRIAPRDVGRRCYLPAMLSDSSTSGSLHGAPDRCFAVDRWTVRDVLAAAHPRAGAQGRPREAHADGALARAGRWISPRRSRSCAGLVHGADQELRRTRRRTCSPPRTRAGSTSSSTLVVLGVLPVHGIVRARIGKFSRGEIKPASRSGVEPAARVAIVRRSRSSWFTPSVRRCADDPARRPRRVLRGGRAAG